MKITQNIEIEKHQEEELIDTTFFKIKQIFNIYIYFVKNEINKKKIILKTKIPEIEYTT